MITSGQESADGPVSAESSSFQTWSCDEVVSWLSDEVKLGQYASIFRENEIDGAELTSLTSAVLQNELGIGKITIIKIV